MVCLPESVNQLLFIFFKRYYLFIEIKERERDWQRHRQREKQAPCREPDVGLDPGSPGSRPGLQAALNRCATGAALNQLLLGVFIVKRQIYYVGCKAGVLSENWSLLPGSLLSGRKINKPTEGCSPGVNKISGEVAPKLLSRACDTQAGGGGKMWVAKKREQPVLRHAGEQG